MLTHLSVNNFAITEHMEIELAKGTTVITGETGAGKSIMLDALSLAIGGRADAKVVRAGASRADISATFDISDIAQAKQWLNERDLSLESAEDESQECILRRTITKEGRSRAYINGQPITLQELKSFSEHLIDIHGQHAHQSLTRPDHQRQLLDEFANAASTTVSKAKTHRKSTTNTHGKFTSINQQIKSVVSEYQRIQVTLSELQTDQGNASAQAQLKAYQVEELNELDLHEDEFSKLEHEQKQLANGDQIIEASQHALALCQEGELNVVSILNQVRASLSKIPGQFDAIDSACELIETALIQAEEATNELQHFTEQFELNPQRQHEVETRLSTIYDIARKHKVKPHELEALHQQLTSELESLTANEQLIKQLDQQSHELEVHYLELCLALSKKRKEAAKKFEKKVNAQLQALSMQHCRLIVDMTPRKHQKPHLGGLEEITFLVSTNPGQPEQPIAKIASGGELSRISLAIQVISAQTSATPTLVFDEVDVGIGGATAEVVGQLLRGLGEHGQVLCVTHQAQVASKGHQHLFVSKSVNRKTTLTELRSLEEQEKVEEIARMLGGIAITSNTRAHAQELLATH